LEASEVDVALVLADGMPRVADPALVPALGALADAGRMEARDGVVRWIGDQRALPSREPGGRSERRATIDSSRIAR
jgi:hypothetical protein